LQKIIADLPNVVFSTKPHKVTKDEPEGVLLYVRTADDNDALAWVDMDGKSITESQFAILKAAECTAKTPALSRLRGTLFDTQDLHRAVEDIYNHPLRPVAIDTLNRLLGSGISDQVLAERAIELRKEGRLCIVHAEEESREPRIICSMGLRSR
jgi:hypothetical protein